MCQVFKLKTCLVLVVVLLTACGQGATPLPVPTPIPPTSTLEPSAVPTQTSIAIIQGDPAMPGVVLPTKDEPRWLQDQATFQKAGFDPLFSQGAE